MNSSGCPVGRMPLTALILVLVTLFGAVIGRADTLVLKNGETLKGKWDQVVGESLVFHSKTAGPVTVPGSQIQSFSTVVPAVALQKNGNTVHGRLRLTSKGQWEVVPAPNAPPVKSFTVIYPAATFQQYQQTLSSMPWLNWAGTASAGYSLQTGNTQSGTLNATVNATRLQPNIPGMNPKWRTVYSLATVLAHTKDTLTGVSISSNTFSTALRQDRLFGADADNFVFVMGEFDYVQPEGIRGRETVGGGFGRDLIKSPRATFSVLGGMTFVNTNYLTAGTPSLQSAEPLIGWKLTYKVWKSVVLNHDVNFYPNLSQTGQYNFDTETSLAAPLFKKLSFQISYLDLYVSNPPPASRKNNATFSAGISYTF